MTLIIMSILGCYSHNDNTVSPTKPLEVSSTNIIVSPEMIGNSSPTPTPLVVSTFTLAPTFTAEDGYKTLESMIKENDRCDLPCWLNVTPGQTEYRNLENHFLQFSEIGYTEFSSKYAYLDVEFPIFDLTTLVYPSSQKKVAYIKVETSITKTVEGYRSDYGNPTYVEMWETYFLPELVKKYGMPEHVFVDTTLWQPESKSNYPFVVWVVYSDLGFLLRYQGINQKVGENLAICPSQSSIRIVTWNPAISNFEQFIKDDEAMASSLGPQAIERVTDFDLESFYQLFKNGGLDSCFYTPAKYWPPNN